LFEEKFLKNIINLDTEITRKLYNYERLYSHINPENYELMRKLSWLLSKLFYKKSEESYNSNNFKASLQEAGFAGEYLNQYDGCTRKLERSEVLRRHQYLDNNSFIP